MFWLKILKSIVKILHSDISPSQIAWGVSFGVILGLTPLVTLNKIIILFIVFILPVNIGSTILFGGIFALISYLIDPIAHSLGYFLLVKVDLLFPLWKKLYNMPIIPYTKFNNTVVLGSFVISILLFVPIYIISKKFINFYRQNLKSRIEQWKIIKLLNVSSIYSFIKKYND